MQRLQELLNSVSSLSPAPSWSDCSDRISEESDYLNNLLRNSSITIYGANTLTGHRVNESVSTFDLPLSKNDLLHSHTIGSAPWYSNYTARCITNAKMYSWSAGMSGVSPTLFSLVAELSANSTFNPKIPMSCSYSSGDVIPASHWATAVLDELKQYSIQPGETMALINGNFIHVGYAAALIKKINNSWLFYIELSSIFNTITHSNSSNLFSFMTAKQDWASQSVDYIKSQATKIIQKNTQDPMSLRALPQTVAALCSSIEEYTKEINEVLFQPSGNPLFDINSTHPLSQASFLAPTLAIKSGALIESILFVMWSMVGRTNYLLSGKVPGIPLDAANRNSPLGLIQYPKLMMSILEKARCKYGRRTFASGSQTSYGVEDLWSNGITVLEQLDELLDDFLLLCSIELYIINYIDKAHDIKPNIRSEIINFTKECSNPKEIKNSFISFIDGGELLDLSDLLPVKA